MKEEVQRSNNFYQILLHGKIQRNILSYTVVHTYTTLTTVTDWVYFRGIDIDMFRGVSSKFGIPDIKTRVLSDGINCVYPHNDTNKYSCGNLHEEHTPNL